jgi:hypothetical protein
VKPYVKRHKNDATDAEAICEAVTRPNMRFVATKTPEQQSSALACSLGVTGRKRCRCDGRTIVPRRLQSSFSDCRNGLATYLSP